MAVTSYTHTEYVKNSSTKIITHSNTAKTNMIKYQTNNKIIKIETDDLLKNGQLQKGSEKDRDPVCKSKD